MLSASLAKPCFELLDAMRKPILMQENKLFGSFLLIPSILIYELILTGVSIRHRTWYSGVEKGICLLEKELWE